MSDYWTRHTIWIGEEETLWVETTQGGGLWLGLTVEDQTAQTLYTVPVSDLRRVSDALAAVVTRLEREEQQ